MFPAAVAPAAACVWHRVRFISKPHAAYHRGDLLHASWILFKQTVPSCKPTLLLHCFPGSFPECQDYFSSEVCTVFLFKQKFAGITNSSLLPGIPRFSLAHYSRCTFLPEKYFLEKAEPFTNAKTVGVPAFTKYLQRLRDVLWLPRSRPSVRQNE